MAAALERPTIADVNREDIYFALDLDFSDGFRGRGENVRTDTISGHRKRLVRAVKLKAVDGGINVSLLLALGEGHPSPDVYALDFPSDLAASLYIVLGGYYKQALLCLRNWMEMRFLGIYFGRVDASKYGDWKRGVIAKGDALFGTALITKLFSRAEFHKADARNGVRGRMLDLYGTLSVFTHGQGLERHGLQDDTDNVPRYNPKSADLYFDLLEQTFAEVVYALWLAYGEAALGHLQPAEGRIVASVLPPAYVTEMALALAKIRRRRPVR